MARVAKAVGSVKVRGGQVVSCGWLLPACLPPTPVPHVGGYCPPDRLPHPSLMWVATARLPASHTRPSCGWLLPACLPPTPVPHVGGHCLPACLPHPSLMWVAIACLPASHTRPSPAQA